MFLLAIIWGSIIAWAALSVILGLSAKANSHIQEVKSGLTTDKDKIIKKFEEAINLGIQHWAIDPVKGWICVHPRYSSIIFNGINAWETLKFFVAEDEITYIIPDYVKVKALQLVKINFQTDQDLKFSSAIKTIENKIEIKAIDAQPSVIGYQLYIAIRNLLSKNGWDHTDDLTIIRYGTSSLEVRYISYDDAEIWTQGSFINTLLTKEQEADLVKMIHNLWNSLPKTSEIEKILDYTNKL